MGHPLKTGGCLENVHDLRTNSAVAIRFANLLRTYQERLVQNGFLKNVSEGW